MKTEIEPDDKRLYDQFRSGGMDPDGAFTAVQEIRKMAGQNILAKMDAHTAELRAQSAELRSQGIKQSEHLEKQVAKLNAENMYIRWFLSAIAIFIGLIITASQLYLALREEAHPVQHSESPTAQTHSSEPATGPSSQPAGP